MKTKNLFVILALFMIFACCIGAASAVSDDIVNEGVTEMDLADESVSISNDNQASDVDQTDDASAAQENKCETTLESAYEVQTSIDGKQPLTSQEESILAYDGSGEVLSAYGVTSEYFSVEFTDNPSQISSTAGGNVNFYITPCTMTAFWAFDFLFEVYQTFEMYEDGSYSYGDLIYQQRLCDESANARIAQGYYWQLGKGYTSGLYLLVARNRMDNKIMDYNLLAVSGNVGISSTDYNAYYNSGNVMTVSVVDKSNNKPINYGKINVVFTNGNSKVERSYSVGQTGRVSFVPPVGAGTWTVTIDSGYTHQTATVLKKTITVLKPAVTLSAVKHTTYKGGKSTLKVTVKSQGKNVNEGTVTFKVNGKSYNVKVKDGVATKKVKLPKAKTYKYTATFKGSNYQTPKAVSSKAVVSNPSATKIILKDLTAYTMSLDGIYQKATAKVLTKSGKAVKSGKLIIDGKEIEVENGKAYLQVWGLRVSDHYKGGSSSVQYFKKTITKTLKVKYVPTSNQYKSSSIKIKIHYKFKCNICGKTTTHYHENNGQPVKLVIS